MKIIYLSLNEFESLDRDPKGQIRFQNKTFAKGGAFSERIYRRMVDDLSNEGDHTTSCLIVDVNYGYFVWHEVKLVLPKLVLPNEDRNLLNASRIPALRSSLHYQDEIATLIALLVNQTLEEALTRRRAITFQQVSEILADVVDDSDAALKLAEEVFIKLEQTGTIALISQFIEREQPLTEPQKQRESYSLFPTLSKSPVYQGVPMTMSH